MNSSLGAPVAALVLTGGRSRRMGSDKTRLVDPHTRSTLAQRTADLVKGFTDMSFEVGPGCTDLDVVAEDQQGAGPLAAIAAGAQAIASRLSSGPAGAPAIQSHLPSSPAQDGKPAPAGGSRTPPQVVVRQLPDVPVLVLATDLPLLDTRSLRWLLDRPGTGTTVPIVAGRAQMLCARWSLHDLLRAPGLVARGERSVKALLDACPHAQPCRPDEAGGPGIEPWTDVDTPDDAEALELRPPAGARNGVPHSSTEVRVVSVRPGPSGRERDTGPSGRERDTGARMVKPDRVVTEEPLELRAGGPGQDAEAVVVTMRTPGHDFELAAGFLVTEGLVTPKDIAAVGYCDAVDLSPEERWNVVSVALRLPWTAPANRSFVSTSSCGVCGKTSIDDLALSCPVVPIGPKVAASMLVTLPDRMRKAQRLFDSTGGLHAAGLFDHAGELQVIREDVGRHNAVDKVIGERILRARGDDRPLVGEAPLLAASGRVSFEVTQKAAMAGIQVIAAVSAPSSLAVSAADRLGITIAGFVRDGHANVYTHPERIDLEA